jgi:outer membrane receptor protein involved in Fe transport
MLTKVVRRSAGLAPMLLLLARVASGQTITGSIDGRLRDEQGRALAGVAVTASGPALIGGSLTVESGPEGYYNLPALPPGTYSLAFAGEGVQPMRQDELIVYAGRTTTADTVMRRAEITDTLVVTASSPVIDRRSAQMAFNYTSDLVEDIPTSRTFHSLVATIPGVESANNYGAFQPGAIELQSVLGSGLRANLYRFEGTNVTDPAQQSAQINLFSYDMIEEVQVLKAAKPAEVGAQGGFFHVITKSGGNDLAGEASVYYRSDGLQSDNISSDLEIAGVDASNQLEDSIDLNLSLGGPLVRDRLWWYASVRSQETTSRVFGFTEQVHDDIGAYFLKTTYSPASRHRLTGFYNHWDQEVDHFFLDFAPTQAKDPQASMFRPIDGETYSLRWDGLLSESLIADFGVGRSRNALDIGFQPGAGVAIIDLVTGDRFQNHGFGSRDHEGENINLNGSMTWLVADAWGQHNLKVGAESIETEVSIGFGDIEDHRLNVIRGNPFAVRLLSTPSLATWDTDHLAVYVQDTWLPAERWSLNLGLRYERSDASTPSQTVSGGTFAGTSLSERFPELERHTLEAEQLLTWDDVAPRFAFSRLLGSGGETVLRGSASRYYHFLESFALFTSNPAFPFTFILRWSDANGDGAFQIGEEGALLSRFGGQINSVAEDAKRPYTDELTLGVSHQLVPDFLVTANLVYKKDRDLLNTIDVGIPFDTYTPTEVADPGPDAVAGTADDRILTVFAQDPATFGKRSLLLTNPAGDDRTYKGLELTAVRRLTGKWQMVGSLVVSEMEVTKPANPVSVTGLYDDPNALINATGKDPLNEEVILKLQGSYQLPWGFLASGFFRYSSGLPFTRELLVEGLPQGPIRVFAEPRGSRETESSVTLDLRGEKVFELGAGLDLGLVLDLFNVTNEATVFAEGSLTGVDLGDPVAVRNPRIARLGLRLRW